MQRRLVCVYHEEGNLVTCFIPLNSMWTACGTCSTLCLEGKAHIPAGVPPSLVTSQTSDTADTLRARRRALVFRALALLTGLLRWIRGEGGAIKSDSYCPPASSSFASACRMSSGILRDVFLTASYGAGWERKRVGDRRVYSSLFCRYSCLLPHRIRIPGKRGTQQVTNHPT